MAKEHEYRVSLTLNRNDPLHRTAIAALEAQGRRKAQFVVNAVTSYIMEDRGRETILQPDRAYIEEICREICQSILREKQIVTERLQPAAPEEDIEENCEFDANMEFINETLSSFRNSLDKR